MVKTREDPLLDEGGAAVSISPRRESGGGGAGQVMIEMVPPGGARNQPDNNMDMNCHGSPGSVPVNGSCVIEEGGTTVSMYPHLSDMEGRDQPQRQHLLSDEEAMAPPPVITPQFQPPDGGCWAWLVMLASFLCNGIIFGTINSNGVIYDELHRILEEEGVENPGARACKFTQLI